MTDADFAALSEADHAIALADAIAETIASGADAVTLGPTDAALVAKLLRAAMGLPAI